MAHPIYPCLWFEGNAKAVAEYYCRIFKNAKITTDSPMVVMVEMNGTKFMLLNGNPQFKFNESMSLVVNCDTQDEIDHYWNSLTADGGEESMCGWLKDKFGVSWQIVPSNIAGIIMDPVKGPRAMQALMKMRKLNIKQLQEA